VRLDATKAWKAAKAVSAAPAADERGLDFRGAEHE
jgi:hypothetical protein